MAGSCNQDKSIDVTAEGAQNGGCNDEEGVDASAASSRITEKLSWVTATTKTNLSM